MPRISVHLLTHNSEKYIPYCLQSLFEQTTQDFSLLVIDNASDDHSVAMVEDFLNEPRHKSLQEKTRIIKNSKNIGFAPAHNQAIQWTTSEYIFVMNEDVILDPDYLTQIIQFLDNHQNVAAASGAIYQWDFSQIEEHAPVPDTLTKLGKTDTIDTLGLILHPSHRVSEQKILETGLNADRPLPVFGVSGALPVYRRGALEHTKVPLFQKSFKVYINQMKPKLYEYFDTDFFTYKEDIDLGYRLRLFGYQSFVVPRARAWHDRTAALFGSVVKNRKTKSHFINYHSYKNHLYFLLKNVPTRMWITSGYKIVFYELIKLGYIILNEPRTLEALKEYFTNLTKMLKKRTYIQKKAGRNAWRYIANSPWKYQSQ